MKRLGLFLAIVVALAVATPTKNPAVAAESRIVGGTYASMAEYPYQVLILFNGYMCGGSLISTQYVLTAAHCTVDDFGEQFAASDFTVYAGLQNMAALGKNTLNPYYQKRTVSAVITHWNYNPSTMHMDVALLRLSSPVMLTAGVKTVKLAVASRNDALYKPGTNATVSGWGAVSFEGNVSDKLREVTVPLVSPTSCKLSYPGEITTSMLCAGLKVGGKDSCQGDSGGPLVVKSGTTRYQVGVVSWGSGCASPNLPGIYTNVKVVFDWIKKNAKLTSW
ncbi:MAG: hypothetical protein RLZZ297_618 [Chloroflexota bacterium]